MSGDVNGRDSNGVYTKLREIHGEVSGLEERLGDRIATSVDRLTDSIDDFKKTISQFYQKNSRKLDLDVVGMMFGMLVLSMAGIQAVEWFFKVYLHK